MTAEKPTDIDDLTAFGAGTHGPPCVKTLILELLLAWGGITKRKKLTKNVELQRRHESGKKRSYAVTMARVRKCHPNSKHS